MNEPDYDFVLELEGSPVRLKILEVDDDGRITFDYMTEDNALLTDEQEQEIANMIVAAIAEQLEELGHEVEYTDEEE